MSSYDNNDIDLGYIMKEIASHKLVVLIVMAIAGVLTYLGLSFVKPVYTSEARILIQNAENSYTKPVFNQGYGQNTVSSSAVGSQVQVLKSNDLAQNVIAQLGLKDLYQAGALGTLTDEEVLEKFLKGLKVSHITGTNVIGIGVSADNPGLSAKIANSLADQFIAWQKKERLAQSVGATSWLKEQIENLRAKVSQDEALMEKYRAKHGLLTSANNISLDTQQLTAVNRQLLDAKTRQANAISRVEAMTQILNTGGDVNGTSSVLRSGLVQRLLELKATKQSQLSELSSSLLPSHPRMKRLTSEIAGLQRQVRVQMKKIIASLKNEAKIAQLRVNSLAKRLNALKDKTGKNSLIQARWKEMERDLQSNRTTLVGYMNRYQDVSGRKDDRSLPIKATIISKAYMSTVPSFPRSITAYSLIAAFAAGLLALLYYGTRAIIAAPTASLQSSKPVGRDIKAAVPTAVTAQSEAQPTLEDYNPAIHFPGKAEAAEPQRASFGSGKVQEKKAFGKIPQQVGAALNEHHGPGLKSMMSDGYRS